MRIEVLGCCGGAAPGCRPTSLLINDTVALDAGALALALPFDRQVEVGSVVLTHAHADHTLSLPFFVENAHAKRGGGIDVHASQATIDSVRRHMFNDETWPDFTRIPDRRRPALCFHELVAGERRVLGDLALTPIPVDHSVPTFGFLIEHRDRAVIWSSDTGPTSMLWEVANRTPGLQAVFIETSFANAERSLAELSRHLTPRLLEVEVDKLERDVPLLVHHLKPGSAEAIGSEIRRLGRGRLELLREREIYTF